MSNQFVVPQFLDVEPRIIGPITVRQFLIGVAVILIEFTIYRLFLNLFWILALGIPVLVLGGLFAFAKVNGQAFHFIVLNIIQTMRRPARRVWDKTLSDADLRFLMQKPPEETPPPKLVKPALESSRLQELALVVNTGGVYQGEDQGK
jgi:hypothetical protein